MSGLCNQRPAQVALLALVIAAAGCNNGPSIKQRADEADATRKAHKQQEEFAKSLPPTQAPPVYKP
jgi:hypothetical protein